MSRLELGDRAPEFELPGTGGQTYRLAGYRGRWVVLAFYPGDFTMVCTRQLCSYRDDREELAALDADVLGISTQSVGSHEKFTAKHDLSVPLLADEDREVSRAYGVLARGGFAKRSIFIVDPEGLIRYRDVSRLSLTYKSADDLEEILAKARASSAA